MPNSNSAKKRLRQNLNIRERNRATKTALRTQLRKVREAVAAGQVDQAESEFKLAAQKLDQAGARHIIHRNTAARYKSRLQKLIKTAKQSA